MNVYVNSYVGKLLIILQSVLSARPLCIGFYLAIQRSVAFGVILSLLFFFVRLRISQRRMVRSA